jgi:lambda repressor-like predicted transcriptional regulator
MTYNTDDPGLEKPVSKLEQIIAQADQETRRIITSELKAAGCSDAEIESQLGLIFG